MDVDQLELRNKYISAGRKAFHDGLPREPIQSMTIQGLYHHEQVIEWWLEGYDENNTSR